MISLIRDKPKINNDGIINIVYDFNTTHSLNIKTEEIKNATTILPSKGIFFKYKGYKNNNGIIKKYKKISDKLFIKSDAIHPIKIDITNK